MSLNFKHQKRKNTGLVYEFTVRQMARQLVDRDVRGYRRTYDVARRHFGPGSYLSKELELFNVVRSSRGLPEAAARKVLQEVMAHAARLDGTHLEANKWALVRDANREFGRDFFSKHRVPEYRLLASLQLLFNSARAANLRERVESIKHLEEAVVRYMTTPECEVPRDARQVDRLVLELAAGKFQEKYGKSLLPQQKKLLECYVRSIVTGSTDRLTAAMEAEVSRVKLALSEATRAEEVVSDHVMRERLSEARTKLEGVKGSASAEAVQELMLYQRLVEELKKDG